MTRHNIKELKPLSGEIEMDETMFGGRRPGKRGWGATGKTLSLAFTKETAKYLLFLSHHVLRKLCSHILPDTPKQEVSTIPMTGLPEGIPPGACSDGQDTGCRWHQLLCRQSQLLVFRVDPYFLSAVTSFFHVRSLT